jgi:hypothetical protein
MGIVNLPQLPDFIFEPDFESVAVQTEYEVEPIITGNTGINPHIISNLSPLLVEAQEDDIQPK